MNRLRSRNRLGALLGFWFVVVGTMAQTLQLPSRSATALSGSQFTNLVAFANRDDRENWIASQFLNGNVPDWIRILKPITASSAGHTATYHTTPDYLAIGSDTDYFLAPGSPLLAQRLATQIGCALPTRRIVNQIWTNAAVKLNPQPIAPSAEMITVPVFAWHNFMVRTQRNAFTNSQPLGSLVSGDKKDLVISTLIYSNLQSGVPKPVVIYGWHYPSGVPIQPLYNGHEETYADYSHGIRLIQSTLKVDGSTNSVSTVLQSPTLNSLLSDEGVIPLPFYSVPPSAPTILVHPANRTVYAGQSIQLETLAIGDPPLTFRWLKNGVLHQTSTNTSIVIPQSQAGDAGNWSVTVSNIVGVVTSRVASVRVRTNAFPEVFRDDFETNSSARWNLFWAASNSIPDFTIDWGYDYVAAPTFFDGLVSPIPTAPNSPPGHTRGVRLTVNNIDAIGSTAALNLYPVSMIATGNFAVKFDLWINYPGNAGGNNSTGSTQHALFGINHLGTNCNWSPPSTTASDGLWFAVDGEGGSSSDFRMYQGNLSGTQSELTGTLAATDHTAAFYQNLFPAGKFETAGAPGKRWVEVELRQTNNLVLWIIDGGVISLRTNTSSFTSGKPMIGLMDVFPSIANPARDSFVLFDNFRVENLTPPPIRFLQAQPSSGGVSLTLTSAPNDTLWLESTTNLTQWDLRSLLMTTNGTAAFFDATSPTESRRFYRAHR